MDVLQAPFTGSVLLPPLSVPPSGLGRETPSPLYAICRRYTKPVSTGEGDERRVEIKKRKEEGKQGLSVDGGAKKTRD